MCESEKVRSAVLRSASVGATYSFRNRLFQTFLSIAAFTLGLHDILHAIVMYISSVKTIL